MVRSLHERLAALERSVGRPADNSVPEPPSMAEAETGTRLEALGFHRLETPHGVLHRRELRYDALTMHGRSRFSDLFQANLAALAKTAKLSNPVQPDRMRFYDTETTGLGTGAGTFPFLHAVGQLEDDEWVVYQYFLDDYGDEGALLNAMWETHFADPDTVVVTYNGKSFDWPLLKARLVMHRIAHPLTHDHIDLLYPSRRLWKRTLSRVSLSHVEEVLLQLTRVADLPGKEAPARYFAYMNERDYRLVEPVLSHNATDVCSLATLACLIADIVSGRMTVSSSAEWVALGQWHDEWSEFDLAERCFVAANLCPDADWRSHWLSALHHKRRGQWMEAVAVWTTMVDLFPWSVQPTVELAKYAEHHLRDYQGALHWAELAIARAANAGDRLSGPLRVRLDRIRSKAAGDTARR